MSTVLAHGELLIDFVRDKGELKTTMNYLKGTENEWIRSVQGMVNERLFSVL